MTLKADRAVTVLEDVSVGLEDDFKDEFAGHSSKLKANDGSMSELDERTVELLELISMYEKTVKKNSLSYINGFLTLSRANYNCETLAKKYGPESWDMRPYNACKVVRISKDRRFELYDVLGELKLEELKLEELKENGRADTDKDPIDLPDSNSGLRNRKVAVEKKLSLIETKESPKTLVKDPINQFGGLVPYQLRQSQSYFSTALSGTLEVANLQIKINEKIHQIEQLSKMD